MYGLKPNYGSGLYYECDDGKKIKILTTNSVDNVGSTSKVFSEDDIVNVQLQGRVKNLEEVVSTVYGTMKAMQLQMKRLEEDNKHLTSLISQVLNHQVPDEMAESVLEDIFQNMA